MTSLESLPADQRAVLQLVLQRGRSYDDIAALLSIDRAGVRARALAAFDALGPQTRVAPESRALITDYLLGQLPPKVSDQVRERLADSASERAWARVLAAELAPMTSGGTGVSPVPSEAGAAREPAEEPRPAPVRRERRERAPAPALAPSRAAAGPSAAASAAAAGAQPETPLIPQDIGLPEPGVSKPSSRKGGAILLGLGALVAVVVVLIVILTSGSSTPKHRTLTVTSTAPGATPTSTSTGSTTPQPVAQINLTSPTSTKTAGIAQVVKSGSQTGIVIAAAGVPPNGKHDAYAVWLYKSATQAKLLGFVNPGVGANGKLSTAGALPVDASQYSQLLVTLETVASPKQPGKIVLEGALSLG
jgi:hypothetical protein